MPYYDIHTFARPNKVYLDGNEIEDVCAAHMEEGWVDCYLRDRRGFYAMDESGLRRKQRRYGRVSVAFFLCDPPEFLTESPEYIRDDAVIRAVTNMGNRGS